MKSCYYLINEVVKDYNDFFDTLFVCSKKDLYRFKMNLDLLLRNKIIVLHYGLCSYQFEILLKKV